MKLSTDHLAKLKKIVTLLNISNDCTIAFLRCNETSMCDTLHTKINEEVATSVFLYEIQLDLQHIHPLEMMTEAMETRKYRDLTKNNKKVAFYIKGFDEAVKLKNADGRSQTLITLNLMRENFLQIPHPILIQINTGSYSLLLKEAGDFFSWRTSVFEFDIDKQNSIIMPDILEYGEFISMNKEELRKRRDYYLELIREHEQNTGQDLHRLEYWNSQLAQIELAKGDTARSIGYFTKALDYSRKLNDKKKLARNLKNLGIAHSTAGDTREAIKCIDEAMALETDDLHTKGVNLSAKGDIYLNSGKISNAIDHYSRSLEIFHKTGPPYDIANNSGKLGLAFIHNRDIEKAREHLEQALLIFNETDDKTGQGRILRYIGITFKQSGDFEKALQYFGRSLNIIHQTNDLNGKANVLTWIGKTFSDQGEYQKAITEYNNALSTFQEIGDQKRESSSYIDIANAYNALGQTNRYKEYFNKANLINMN